MKDGITNMRGFPRDSNTIITITIFTYSQCAHSIHPFRTKLKHDHPLQIRTETPDACLFTII